MVRWVVVGGGAAGCVIAARLSESPDHEVLLLEAGPDPGGVDAAPGAPVLDDPSRLVHHEVVRRVGWASERYPLGCGIGGSSLVNAAVVVDPAAWANGHLLPIDGSPRPGPVGSAVLAATPDARPVGLVAHGSRRATVADAYLTPALSRENLTVRSTTPVDSVELDGRRAIGVTTGSGEHVDADRVVLCAGPVGSPTILLRSGVTTPGVGRHLQDHVGVALAFELAGPPDPEAPMIGVTVERPGRQIVVLEQIEPGSPHGALLAGHLDVTSEGELTLPDPSAPPEIGLRQLSTRHDLDGLAIAVGDALELLGSSPLRPVVGRSGMPELDSPEFDVRAWLAERAPLGGYHHLAGSCRIGVALGEDGWLFAHESLAVCDASALPGVPARNPYLTVVRLAERMVRSWST